jgi:hypothetical protein
VNWSVDNAQNQVVVFFGSETAILNNFPSGSQGTYQKISFALFMAVVLSTLEDRADPGSHRNHCIP